MDAHDEREADTEWIKAKLADIEDRSRRNNLKTSGNPESVQQSDPCLYASTMFKALILSLTHLSPAAFPPVYIGQKGLIVLPINAKGLNHPVK